MPVDRKEVGMAQCTVTGCETVIVFDEEVESGICEGHMKLQEKDEVVKTKQETIASNKKYAYYLKKTHRIAIEDYEEMLKEQGGKCASCKLTDTRRLAVDVVSGHGLYGLLCNRCDIIARNLRKNPEMLKYLSERFAI